MRREFEVHLLNAEGKEKAIVIAEDFSLLLDGLEKTVEIPLDSRGEGAREMALARTHLELANFYAKRAMAVQKKNQA